MRVRLDLDPATWRALERAARQELRPLDWQALALIRRALGLPEGEPEPLESDEEVAECSQ